jgi:hypothetical protein
MKGAESPARRDSSHESRRAPRRPSHDITTRRARSNEREYQPDRRSPARVVERPPAPAIVGNQAMQRQRSAPAGQPLPTKLAQEFGRALGQDLSDVRVYKDSPVAAAANAPAFAKDRDLTFAPGQYRPNSRSGQQLIAHEVAHVAQQSRVRPGSPITGPDRQVLEARADAAADAILRGRTVPALGAPAKAYTQYAPPQGADPGTAESPVSAQIAQDVATAKPGPGQTTITLEVPGFGDQPKTKETIVIAEPVLGATMVTIYSVPLTDLFATPEDAAEAKKKKSKKDREALSLFGTGNAARLTSTQTPAPATASTTAPASTATASTPPPNMTPGPPATAAPVTDPAGAASGTTGAVANAGPSPGGTVETAYDLNGQKIGLIERVGSSGLTTEFTKLSVGAASCGVYKTKSGVMLIDAGVRHDGATVDAAMVKRAMTRLGELVGHEPIRDILITHAHLDHIALLNEISKNFVIEKITINSIQLADPRFAEQAKQMAENQRKLLRERLTDKYSKSERAGWMEREGNAYPEEKAREAKFKEFVNERVATEVAAARPIDVHVTLPSGSTINAGDVKIGGIEIKPKTATQAAAEGFVAQDPFRTTVLDPKFKAKYDAYLKELAKNPNAKFPALDTMSSSYLMELPNGNHLIVVPDIRTSDFKALQNTLIKQFKKLGADVGFRVWDMTHHAQKGWVSTSENQVGKTTGAAKTVTEAGVLRASQLSGMTELLTKLTQAAPGRAGGVAEVVVVSVDLAKVDPALLHILKASGFETILAHGEQDVQFVEAETAKGRKVAGLAGGEVFGAGQEPVIRRANLALEALRKELEHVTELAKREAQDRKADAARRESELKPDRDMLREEIRKIQRQRATALKNVNDPGPQVAKRPIAERQAALASLDSQLEGKQGELALLDQQIELTKKRELPSETRKTQIKESIARIEKAKTSYIRQVHEHYADVKKGAKTPASYTAAEKELVDATTPAYRDALSADLPRVSETSLILLNKNVAKSPGNTDLVDAWRQTEAARAAVASGVDPLHAHGKLIEALTKLKTLVAARKDVDGQHAVADEIERIDKQLKTSQEILKKAAESGAKSTTRDAGSGMKVETSVFGEKPAVDTDTKAPADPAAKADPAATTTDPAKTAPADAPVPSDAPAGPKKPGLLQKGMVVADRLGGGLMVLQTVQGAGTLLQRYGKNEANAPETAIGLTKSALGVSIGYRMLRGAHVGMGEFVILSVLDITQTLLADYESTEQRNAAVAYSVVSNSVNLALSLIGMALIATANPVGIIAGFVVMMLGESILDFFGVREWLEKKFAFMPDTYIEVQKDLEKLVQDYDVLIGAIELEAQNDATLKTLGAKDPAAFRAATKRVVDAREMDLGAKERPLLAKFTEAYKEAKEGYAGFKELDDLRFRFLSLHKRVHNDADDTTRLARANMEARESPVTTAEVNAAFAESEKRLAPDSISEAGVADMPQWTKMDAKIDEMKKALYETSYGDIDWMEVSEFEHQLDLMVSNALYRLDPGKQGSHRLTPLFSEGTPARIAYENELNRRENKLDVLRARKLELVQGAPGRDDEEKPDFGNVDAKPDTETQLNYLQDLVMKYQWQVDSAGGLPGYFTVQQLYSDATVLGEYRKEVVGGDLRAMIFAMKGSKISVAGALARAHRLLDGRELTDDQKERLQTADTRFKKTEEDRLVEYGYLFLEEVDSLMPKIGRSKVAALASALGEAPDAPQISEQQRAALGHQELADHKLTSMRDRITELGLTLPDSDTKPIERVYRVKDAGQGVLVAVKPDRVSEEDQGEDGAGEPMWWVIPLNDAAITHFGDRNEHRYSAWKLEPVTLASLKPPEPVPAIIYAPAPPP